MPIRYRCTDPYPVYLKDSSVHHSLVTLMDQYQRHRRNHHLVTIVTAFSLSWQVSRDVHAPVAQPRLFRPEYALMDRDSGIRERMKQNY